MAIEDHLPIVKNIAWPDEVHTRAFAGQLAGQLMQLLPAGNALIELRGELGAGKTTLVRYLLQALGIEGRIKSPTYAVVEAYILEAPVFLQIWHFDFYRFNDPDEWEEAGFRDLFASPGLKLVEWPEKAGKHLPTPDLRVHIDTLADARRQIRLEAHTGAGARLIEQVSTAK